MKLLPKLLLATFFTGIGQFAPAQIPCESIRSLDSDPERGRAVDEIFSKWHQTEFSRICKKNKMPPISCAGCTGIWAEVVLSIDSSGAVKEIKFEKGLACGEQPTPQFQKDILRSLSKLSFPDQFRNACFRKRVGRALRC